MGIESHAACHHCARAGYPCEIVVQITDVRRPGPNRVSCERCRRAKIRCRSSNDLARADTSEQRSALETSDRPPHLLGLLSSSLRRDRDVSTSTVRQNAVTNDSAPEQFKCDRCYRSKLECPCALQPDLNSPSECVEEFWAILKEYNDLIFLLGMARAAEWSESDCVFDAALQRGKDTPDNNAKICAAERWCTHSRLEGLDLKLGRNSYRRLVDMGAVVKCLASGQTKASDSTKSGSIV